MLDEIGSAEGALESALSQSEGYAERIAGIDAEMTNCRMLKNRNASLLSQYESDIKRLTFIVEGDIHSEKVPALDRCPFCNGELPKEKGESCIDAAIAEVEKVESQIKDLKSVQISIDKEIEELKGEREKIYAERKRVDATIRGELRPQIADLKNVLADYTLALGQYKAKEMIEAFSDVLVKELEVSVAENSTEFHFNLKEKLIEIFQEKLNEDLKAILEACNYHNFTGVRFDMDTYDVIVNGHLKKSQGKGYRAFLNTVVAISFQNCIDAYSNIKKHFMVIDSPILSLKEKEDHDQSGNAPDNMKTGLFKYLISHQDARQTIIIENTLPNLDYSNVHIEEFTKDENRGRYGLLMDYRE